MSDILCLGEPLVEFNLQSDGRWLEGYGGDTSNVAIAAARQGASAGMIASIGTDAFGDGLMALWRAEGVATDHVTRHPVAPTGIYFVRHTEEGHGFSYRREGSAASLMTPADVPRAAIEGARVLHVSGISQAISGSAADSVFTALRVARDAGVVTSYDPNLRLRLWPLDRARAVIHAAMGLTDIALPGYDDACQLTGLTAPQDIANFYHGLGVRIVALTLGSDGALVSQAGGPCKALAPHSATLVDASGAGDCFDGAFLAEYLRTGDPFSAGAYANRAAALKVQEYGAIAGIPRRSKVEAAQV